MMPTFLLLLAFAGSPSPAQAHSEGLEVGDHAPELSCTDVNGRPISWQLVGDKALTVLFHSEDMAFSRQSIRDLTLALRKASDLQDRMALLVVTNGRRDLGELSDQLADSGVTAWTTVDADRSQFDEFHVVAFPTVFCLSSDRLIREVVKGYGPLFSFKVIAASRMAAGLIDQETWERRLATPAVPAYGEQGIRVARTVRMARELLDAGMFEQAFQSLRKVIDLQSSHIEGVGLLARVLLRQQRPEAAKPWIQRLTGLSPESRELRLLRAELALQEGKTESAARELEGLDDARPEVSLLKGRVLEQGGHFREAAVTYRRALEAMLKLGN
jgi:tetratricopeptide (TPR) repeat protein